MKTLVSLFVRLTFTALLLSCCTSVFAQKVATWKGGTPGQLTEWNCPKNWKEGQVPNEFSQVIIPDVSSSTFNNPVITNGEVEVLSILIHSGASLLIGKGARLIALEQEEQGMRSWSEGILRAGTPPQRMCFALQYGQ